MKRLTHRLKSEPLDEKKTVGPHLVKEEYRRKNKRAMGYMEWSETVCSECHLRLHETAKFCVHCGATFEEK
jgi:hypothetical protein